MQVQANKQDRVLTISGERAAPAVPEAEKDMRRRRERRFGKFRRTFQVRRRRRRRRLAATLTALLCATHGVQARRSSIIPPSSRRLPPVENFPTSPCTCRGAILGKMPRIAHLAPVLSGCGPRLEPTHVERWCRGVLLKCIHTLPRRCLRTRTCRPSRRPSRTAC